MPMIGTGEAFCLRYLRAKVTQDKDGRRIRPQKDRANQQFEFVHGRVRTTKKLGICCDGYGKWRHTWHHRHPTRRSQGL